MISTNNGKFAPEYGGKLSSGVNIGPFPDGIDNYSNANSMSETSLSDALNVDVYNDGHIKTRSGYKLLKKSDYSNLSQRAYFDKFIVLKNASLYTIDADLNETLLYSDFGYSDVYYLFLNNELYISNGFNSIIYSGHNNTRKWTVDSPSSVGYEVSTGTGYLKKGKYIINYSFLYGNYESSVALKHEVVDITEDNSEIIFNIQNNYLNTGFITYVSEINGTVLYSQGNNANIKNVSIDTKQPIEGLVGFPACEKIQLGWGRVFGIHENNLIFTEAMEYNQYNPYNNIQIDNSKILMLNVLQSGVFIGTEQGVYMLTFDSFEAGQQSLSKISDDVVVEGSLFQDKERNVWGFISKKNGLVIYEQGLSYKNEKVKLPIYSKCNTVIVNKPGLKQVIFNFADEDVKLNSLSIKDFDKSFKKFSNFI